MCIYNSHYLSFRFVSILTVFVNKHLLSSDSVKLEAPLFVTWFQCVISALICFIISRISKVYPSVIKFPEGNPLDIDTFRKVSPFDNTWKKLYVLVLKGSSLSRALQQILFYEHWNRLELININSFLVITLKNNHLHTQNSDMQPNLIFNR